MFNTFVLTEEICITTSVAQDTSTDTSLTSLDSTETYPLTNGTTGFMAETSDLMENMTVMSQNGTSLGPGLTTPAQENGTSGMLTSSIDFTNFTGELSTTPLYDFNASSSFTTVDSNVSEISNTAGLNVTELLTTLLAEDTATDATSTSAVVITASSTTTMRPGCYVPTVDGNANGAICVLPFIYQGMVYYECTLVDREFRWCSTTANYDADELWGYCEGMSLQKECIECFIIKYN